MKTLKKFLAVIFLCLVTAFGITACKDESNGGSSSLTGVYYLYENDTYNKSDYYELLSDNEWRDNDGETGTYSVSGSTITFYYSFDGETEELFDGTITDGVMCLNIFDVDTYYCKEGKTPSGNSGSSENDNGQTETQYTVTYNANGGVFASGETTLTATAKNNSTLTAPDSPTRTNYTFAGWATSGTDSNKWNFSTDKVTGDITLYATWSQESAAILSVDGASIDGLNIFMFVDKNTDSVSLASRVVCSDDSVWKLYYDKLGQTEIPTKIAADMSGELLDGGNLFYMVVTSQDGVQVNVYELNVYRSYAIDVCYYDGDTLLKTETAYTGYEFTPTYNPTITGYKFNDWNYTPRILWDDLELYADKTANTYTVTYDVNGGDELATTEKTVTYDSGYTLAKTERTGYTFLGWYSGNTQITDGNGKSLAVWNYAKNLTVKAKWQANEYAVTLETNNSSAGTMTGAGNYAYDSNVTITATTNKGYTWLGWYDKNDELVTSELFYKFKMGFAVTYKAKWSKTTVNSVGGGSVTFLNSTYKMGQTVTVKATTYLGYTFDGWYNGDTLLTTEKNYTFAMSAEDTTYTAKWHVAAEMSNFSFSSSTTTCSITRVKDATVSEIIVPDYVTSISTGAFKACSSLTSITLPFVGATKGGTSNTYFGYIFGADSYSSNSSYVPTSLKRVTITSATSIGSYAFDRCSSLTSVMIGDSVTSIGEESFSDCSSLTSVMIGDSVTSIGEEAFYNCSSLTNVYISNLTAWCNISGLSNLMSYGTTNKKLYLNNELVTELEIPNTITEIKAYAFYNCHSLNGVYITDIEAWCNISFGNFAANPLYYAKKLYLNNELVTELEIPNTITEIKASAFRDCSSLTSVVIPDSVTSIGSSAFRDCSSLTSITLPFVGATKGGTGYTHFGYIFGAGSYSSNSIVVPTSLKRVTITSATSIGSYAFYDCSRLTEITIPDSITSIGSYAFYDCHSLTGVYITDIEAWCNISFGNFAANPLWNTKNLYLNNELVTELEIPNTITEINDYAFYNCSSLTSVVIPDSVTSIGSSAFENCSSLTNVVIGDSVTSIGEYAFCNCCRLVEVCNKSSLAITAGSNTEGEVGYYAKNVYTPISGESKLFIDNNGYAIYMDDTDKIFICYMGKQTDLTLPNGVTEINDYAFYNCSSLTSVVIPDSVTSIGSYAFYYCAAEIKWGNNPTITSIGEYAFYGYKGTSIEIPDSVTSIGSSAFSGYSSLTEITIPDSVTSIGSYAFAYCDSLTSVTIPDRVTSIGSSAFRDCSSLTSVVIGDGVTSIGSDAFFDCDSLTSVVIGDSVTSIGSDVFDRCSRLTEITIPDSVTSIDSWAFDDCYSLTSVYYKGTAEDWEKVAISFCNEYLTSATRYYYSESEPSLNDNGTAYEGNYWYYNDDNEIVVWVYTKKE